MNSRRSLKPVYERSLRSEGYLRPAGLDEAGRGCLAGPVVAAAVILDPGRPIRGLADSKLLAPEMRELRSEEIREKALACSVVAVPAGRVDEINILEAAREAMIEAFHALEPAGDFALVDGMRLPALRAPQRGLIGGDSVCASIAAASILAKVVRDRMMVDLDRQYPLYNLAANKGYGTPEHREALALHGPCPCHRRTFRGVPAPSLPFEELPSPVA